MFNRNLSGFPVLKTERLTLRQLSQDDAPAIFTLRSDAEINRYLDREPSKTIGDATAFITKINDITAGNKMFYWGIEMTGSSNLAGTICLFNFSEDSASCEIGYELLPDYQGQGIMLEAAVRVIEFATTATGVQKIEASSHKDNAASRRLLEKLHFSLTDQSDQSSPDLLIFAYTH